MLQGLDADPRCGDAPGPAWGRVVGEEPGEEKGRGSSVSNHSLAVGWGSREPGGIGISWFASSALG